jgi:hypothetical protein
VTETDEAGALLERLLAGPLEAIAAGDPLQAELETSAAMAIPRLTAEMDPAQADAFIAGPLVSAARRHRSTEGAALLRLLMSLGSPAVKRAASAALADLTAAGRYPADWVNQVGKPVPVQAWRRYDAFGDDEAVAVCYRYDETEHGIVVQIDRVSVPTVVTIAVADDTTKIREVIGTPEGEFGRAEEISLAQARERIEPALSRSAVTPVSRLNRSTLAYLPITRSRVRRLPTAEQATGTGQAASAGQAANAEAAAERTTFSAADRAAAVADFMRSSQGAEAVAADADATLFWAQVLTGYSSRIPGEPPAQVGPRKLAFIVLSHVPDTFTVTPEQRDHLVAAVTAWTRWSAAYRGLDDAAADYLTTDLPGVLAQFDELYDDPGAVTDRAYLADLVTGDVDIAWLAAQADRREFAAPMAGNRGASDLDALDASDPASRRAIATAEFAGCTPPSGQTAEEFLAGVHRVVEELWQGEPLATWTTAQRMLAQGRARHDIIHALAG